MAIVKTFAALKNIVTFTNNVDIKRISKEQEIINTMSKEQYFGLSEQEFKTMTKSDWYKNEETRLDAWFNRKERGLDNGPIINVDIIKEARAKMHAGITEADNLRIALNRAETRNNNMKKNELRAEKRAAKKQGTEMSLTIHGSSFKDEIKSKSNKGVSMRKISMSKEAWVETMVAENADYRYGPSRFCNCFDHKAILKEAISELKDEIDCLDSITDEDRILYLESQVLDLEDIVYAPHIKTELSTDGAFVCPVCNESYKHEDLRFDYIDEDEIRIDTEYADRRNAILESFKSPMHNPEMSNEIPVVIDKCKKVNLIGKNKDTIVENVKALFNTDSNGSLSYEDYNKFEVIESLIMTPDELIASETSSDGLGNECMSYEAFMGYDSNDMERNDGDDTNDTHDELDIAGAVDKILPWIGESVDIRGMLDFNVRNSFETTHGHKFILGKTEVKGMFADYYFTNHTILRERIQKKAEAAKAGINKVNRMIDIEHADGSITEERNISDDAYNTLIERLTDEYYYWMAWTEDEEWNGYKKVQNGRNKSIDHVRAGGTLKYYVYINRDGKICFGSHPDTYTMTSAKYIEHGDTYMLAEDDYVATAYKVFTKIAPRIVWNYNTYKGYNFVNIGIKGKDGKVHMGYGGFENGLKDVLLDICGQPRMAGINTYRQFNNLVETDGMTKFDSSNELISKLAEMLKIDIVQSIKKHRSSNKWLADIDVKDDKTYRFELK